MFTLSEIAHLVGKPVFDGLSRDGGVRFEAIKQEAIQRLANLSGAAFLAEGTRPPELNWALTPFAWIVEYLAITHFQNLSPEYLSQAKFKYQEACNIAAGNAITKREGKRAVFGEIEGVYKL